MIEDTEKTEDELMEELKNEFLESISECLVDLQLLIKEKKFDEIAKLAHDIKGTAGVFGLHEGSEIADKLQNSSKVKDLDNSKALIDSLVDYMKKNGVIIRKV